jgi:hypothetical protein
MPRWLACNVPVVEVSSVNGLKESGLPIGGLSFAKNIFTFLKIVLAVYVRMLQNHLIETK